MTTAQAERKVRASAQGEIEAQQAAARSEIESLRAAAESEAAEIRTEAERRLEQAAAAYAGADREAAARLAQAEHEARRRADEILADAERHSATIRESEQSTYLRLLAARDDLQQAIDRVASQIAEVEDGSIVDLTTAPAQVHPAPSSGPTEPAPASARARLRRRRARSRASGPSGRPTSIPPAKPATPCCAWCVRPSGAPPGLDRRRGRPRGVGLLSRLTPRLGPSLH